MPGPAPLPTAVKELRGNPGHRPLNKNEPQPKRTAPRMPDNVKADEHARKHWKRIVPLLTTMRVLTEADGVALGNLCFDIAMLEQAQAKLQKSGLLIKSGRSQMIHANPLLAVVAATTDRVTKGLREFGLTPSSRSRLVTTPTPTVNKWTVLRDQIGRV